VYRGGGTVDGPGNKKNKEDHTVLMSSALIPSIPVPPSAKDNASFFLSFPVLIVYDRQVEVMPLLASGGGWRGDNYDDTRKAWSFLFYLFLLRSLTRNILV
jgi:hypothetical protein